MPRRNYILKLKLYLSDDKLCGWMDGTCTSLSEYRVRSNQGGCIFIRSLESYCLWLCLWVELRLCVDIIVLVTSESTQHKKTRLKEGRSAAVARRAAPRPWRGRSAAVTAGAAPRPKDSTYPWTVRFSHLEFQALLFLSRINRTRYIPPLSHTIIPPPARWLLRSSANACGTFHFSTDHGSSRIPDRSLRPGGFLMRRSFAFLGSKGSDSDDDSSHDSNRAKRSSSPKASSSTRFLGSSRSSPEHGAAGRFAAPIGRGCII